MKNYLPLLQNILPGALILAVLGLYALGGAPLSTGEMVLLQRASAPLEELTESRYSPLYLLILHLWSTPLQHPFWLRLPGVLAALAALVLSERVMRHLGGVHATPGAALLLGAAPFFIAQARLVSPAPLALVALLACFLCFVEFVRSGDLKWLAGWIVSILLALGLHAGMIYVALIHCGVMLAYRHRYRHRQWAWWVLQIPLLGFFYLIFGDIVQHFFTARLSAAVPGSALLMDVAYLFGFLATLLPPPPALAGAALFAVLLLSGVWACKDWRKDARHGLLVLSFVVPFLLWVGPLGHASYGLAALPFLLSLVSMGIRLYSRWLRQLLWSAVAVSYLWGYWHLYK